MAADSDTRRSPLAQGLPAADAQHHLRARVLRLRALCTAGAHGTASAAAARVQCSDVQQRRVHRQVSTRHKIVRRGARNQIRHVFW